MSEILNEQLSALIDGELPAAETALLMKRLEREPELRARLARYQACGATLRGGQVEARADFSLRVSRALTAEPCHAAPARRARRGLGLLKPLAGLAVAATVAAAALITLERPVTAPATAPAQLASTARPAARAPVHARTPATRAPAEAPAAPVAQFASSEPRSYVTPALNPNVRPAEIGLIPRGELANYALAHSGVVGPFGAHSLYTSLVSDDDGSETPAR